MSRLTTVLTRPVTEAFRDCFETIEDAKRCFTRQKQKLVVVRELKEKQALEANDDGFKDGGENDLFPEASSMSGFSAVSASSKGSRMTDLPPLTQPVLRTDIHWQLSVLS
eukprot:gene9508-10499_t